MQDFEFHSGSISAAICAISWIHTCFLCSLIYQIKRAALAYSARDTGIFGVLNSCSSPWNDGWDKNLSRHENIMSGHTWNANRGSGIVFLRAACALKKNLRARWLQAFWQEWKCGNSAVSNSFLQHVVCIVLSSRCTSQLHFDTPSK